MFFVALGAREPEAALGERVDVLLMVVSGGEERAADLLAAGERLRERREVAHRIAEWGKRLGRGARGLLLLVGNAAASSSSPERDDGLIGFSREHRGPRVGCGGRRARGHRVGERGMSFGKPSVSFADVDGADVVVVGQRGLERLALGQFFPFEKESVCLHQERGWSPVGDEIALRRDKLGRWRKHEALEDGSLAQEVVFEHPLDEPLENEGIARAGLGRDRRHDHARKLRDQCRTYPCEIVQAALERSARDLHLLSAPLVLGQRRQPERPRSNRRLLRLAPQLLASSARQRTRRRT